MRSFRPENRTVEDDDIASACGCPVTSPRLFSPFLSTKPSIPLFRDLRDELGYVDQRQEVLPTRGRSAGLSKAQSGSGKPILYQRFVGGVVGVAARVVAIEGAAVIWVQRQAEFDPPGQVGIRDEVTTEGDQAGIAVCDACLCRLGIESTGCDDRPLEDLAQFLGCDRRLRFGNGLTALHPRFDEVKIREPEAVEPLCHRAEQRTGVAVAHAVERPAWRESDPDPIRTPYLGQPLDDLDEKPHSILDRTAVFIGPL